MSLIRRLFLLVCMIVCMIAFLGSAFAQELFAVARSGSLAEVRAVLAAGANVHARDEFGQTPLHYAAEHNSAAVVDALLDAGADVRATAEGGWSVLQYAFRNQHHPEVIPRLLQRGADPADVLYDRYDNDRFGYGLAYPAGILEAQGEFASGDGQTFLSRDGRAMMVVFTRPVGQETLEGLYEQAVSVPGREVSHAHLQESEFVVFGYEDDWYFFEKTLRLGNHFVILELKHSRQLQPLFHAIGAEVARSFSPSAVEAPAPEQAPQVQAPPPRPAPPPAPPPAAAEPAPPREVEEVIADEPEPEEDGAEAAEASAAPPAEEAAAAPEPQPAEPETEIEAEVETTEAEEAAIEIEEEEAGSVEVVEVPPSLEPQPPRAEVPFERMFALMGITQVACAEEVAAQARDQGYRVLCGQKRQDAISFTRQWDRVMAGLSADPTSSWLIAEGAHRRDYELDGGGLRVIFRDGYIINPAAITVYASP
jgi:hypothetical protein